jgi:polyisoprenoid-binding protein YceI
MKKFSKVKTLTLMFGLTAGIFSAQNISGKSSKITVDGTAPAHNWTMSAAESTFTGTVSGNTITNVRFSMPAKNLKSTKGKSMDDKAYAALKSDKNPNITFAASTLNLGKGVASGRMTIAGTTKNVSIPVNVVKTGDSYTITGTASLKMSDFGMETPSFMFIHTGDAITVNVTITAE